MIVLETVQKKAALLASGGLIVCALFAGCTGTGTSSEASSSDSVTASSESAQSEAAAEGSLLRASYRADIIDALEAYGDKFSSYSSQQLSDAYSFVVEGDEYTMPCKISEFIANGWTLEMPDEFSGSYYELPDSLPGSDEYATFSIFKGEKCLDISATPANGATDWEDCMIFQIKMTSAKSKSTPSFAMKSGIDFSSTAEDVLTTYGCPTDPGAGINLASGGSKSNDEEGDWKLLVLEYSQAKVKAQAEKEKQEEQKEAERKKAAEEGSIFVGAQSVSVSDAKIGSEQLDYDDLKFKLNDGVVSEITVFNSCF